MSTAEDKLIQNRPDTGFSTATAETEFWDDGSLRSTLSPNTGGGINAMQKFIKDHIQCILAPIGEHVTTLEAKAQAHDQQLTRLETKAERHQQRLEEHDDEIGTLQNAVQDMASELAAMNKQMANFSNEQSILQADRSSQQEALAKLEDRLDSTRDSVQALREALEDSDASVHKLQLKQWETSTTVERVQKGHEEIQAKNAWLDMFAQDQKSATGELKRDMEAVQRALEKHGENQTEAGEAIESLTKWRQEVDRALDVAKKALASHDEDLKLLEQMHDDAFNKVKIEPIAAPMMRSSAPVAEPMMMSAPPQKEPLLSVVNQRLRQVEERLQHISDDVSRAVGLGLVARMDKMDQKLNRTNSTCENHTESLRNMDEALGTCREKLIKLDSRTTGLETTCTQLEERATLLETRTEELSRMEREDQRRLDEHHCELENASEHRGRLDRTLAEALFDLKILTSDHGVTKETLAEHGSSLELAHEYIQGVGRGFQDTHRQVLTGANGMLPPVSARERTLPSLPKPRPVSATRRVKIPHE